MQWLDPKKLPKNTLPYTKEAIESITKGNLYIESGWPKEAKISLIAAVGKNRELGKNNQLLWNISADLKHFKEKTFGKPCIMGQKTFESIGRPLPGRLNIVLSKDPKFKAKGVITCDSIDSAVRWASNYSSEVFVIGGGSIYAQTIDLADKLYLTLVDKSFEADVFFPDYSKFGKIVKASEEFESDGLRYKFLELEK